MKTLLATVLLFAALPTLADAPAKAEGATVHRYVVERTFPVGALAGLDAATKKQVNDTNASVGVRWVEWFANADKTKTYCIYEGPNEAAELNKLPVDGITEVPVTLSPQ